MSFAQISSCIRHATICSKSVPMCTRLINRLRGSSVRSFANSPRPSSNSEVPKSSGSPGNLSSEDAAAKANENIRIHHNEQLSALDRWMLVNTKAYPDLQSIPSKVPISRIQLAHDKMRVKIAMVLTILTLALCLILSVRAGRDRRQGNYTDFDKYARQQLGLPAQPTSASSNGASKSG